MKRFIWLFALSSWLFALSSSASAQTQTRVLRSSDAAYDEAVWNGSLAVPTQNAVRDEFEAMIGGGMFAPTDATYITKTANGTLSGEFALGTLSTGLLQVTTGTGDLSSVSLTSFPAITMAGSISAGTDNTYSIGDQASRFATFYPVQIRTGSAGGSSFSLGTWDGTTYTAMLTVSHNLGIKMLSLTPSALTMQGNLNLISNHIGNGGDNNEGLQFDTSGNAKFTAMVQVGGTTSSFPALKRSSTVLQARLADDSAYTHLEVASEAYDAAGWNGDNGAATKDDVRDKLEDLEVRTLQLVAFAPTTDVATGDGAAYCHIPPSLNGYVIDYVHAAVITAGTTNTTDVQIARLRAGSSVDVLSTKLTVDSTEIGSDTAAAAAVINTSNDDLQTNDRLRIDVDAVSTTAPKGLIITIGASL